MQVKFPVEYFRPEIKSGFYVDGMMKRMWASSMKVMFGTFAEVCEKYHIQWYADSGTLLGAVRHHGFIPWDDDVDVRMLRDDYVRFKEIMYDAFPEGYCFLTYDNPENDGSFEDVLTRVINIRRSWDAEEDFLSEYFQCPFSAGIDIFPMDYIPDDPQESEQYRNLCNLLVMGLDYASTYDEDKDNEVAKLAIEGVENAFGYKFNGDRSTKYQCLRLAEAVFGMYHRDECSRVASIWAWARGDGTSAIYPKEWFMNPQTLDFEEFQIPVVSNPEGYLDIQFGPGWKNEDRDYPTHDYPYYKHMEQSLASVMGGGDPFYYHFSQKAVEVLGEDREDDTEKGKRNVIFLIPKASDWKYMKLYYDRLISAGDNVKVVPIPFYDCDLMREPVQTNYEYGLFPDDINLVDYRLIDLSKEHYDEIVISFPYDEFNYTEMVEEKYFSRNLRYQTERLTYISPFETTDSQAMSRRDQVAMKHYVMLPGLIYADTVYVQSDNMKQAYIKRLIDSWKDDCESDEKLKTAISEQELEDIFSKKIEVRG